MFLVCPFVDQRCYATSPRVRICEFIEEWMKIEDLWKWKSSDPKHMLVKVKVGSDNLVQIIRRNYGCKSAISFEVIKQHD